MELVYDEPPAVNVRYLEAVFKTLEYQHVFDIELEGRSPLLDRRIKRSRLLARHLAASEFNEYGDVTKLRHCCQVGCHASLQSAIEEISSLHEEVTLPGLAQAMSISFVACFWICFY